MRWLGHFREPIRLGLGLLAVTHTEIPCPPHPRSESPQRHRHHVSHHGITPPLLYSHHAYIMAGSRTRSVESPSGNGSKETQAQETRAGPKFVFHGTNPPSFLDLSLIFLC